MSVCSNLFQNILMASGSTCVRLGRLDFILGWLAANGTVTDSSVQLCLVVLGRTRATERSDVTSRRTVPAWESPAQRE